MESQKNFASRCEEVTGVAFGLIPRRSLRMGETPPGKILCKRGASFLCTVGYPDGEDDDGDFWEADPKNFVLVCLKDEADLIRVVEAEEDAEALLRLAAEAMDWGWAKAHAQAMAKAIARA